jgi:hypothetical protein
VNVPLLVAAPGIKAAGSRLRALDEPDRPWKRAAFSQYPRSSAAAG